MDSTKHTPTNGDQAVTLVVLSGTTPSPITYTEVINPTCNTTATPPTCAPAGMLGSVSFGGAPGDVHARAILTFSFAGRLEDVVPFFVNPFGTRRPPNGIYPGVGFENIAGTASVKLQDADTGEVLAEGTFLPADKIFVSADNGNYGIGFGSMGLPPADPNFGKIEPFFPYAIRSITYTDLRSNYTTAGGARTACGSCSSLGLTGLATTAGNLTIVQGLYNAAGTFSVTTPATTAGYTLSASPVSPSPITAGGPGSSMVTVTPSAGYHGNVTLSCSVGLNFSGEIPGLPPTPVCTFAPPVVSGGSGTSLLTIATSTQALPGSYNYTVMVDGSDDNAQAPTNDLQATAFQVKQAGGVGAFLVFLAIVTLWCWARTWRRETPDLV
jgi:hypothetical protein